MEEASTTEVSTEEIEESFTKVETKTHYVCGLCEKYYAKDMKFCPYCGYSG